MNNMNMVHYSDKQIDMAIDMLQALKGEQLLRIRLEDMLAAQAGKVLFAEVVSGSSESILVGDLAMILKQAGVETGQERLFAWMRANGYMYRQPCGQNVPTQKSLELGIIEVKQTDVKTADGKTSVKKTPRITPKGQLYFFEQVMAQKDAINAVAAEKKAAKMKRDAEARKKKRQAC